MQPNYYAIIPADVRYNNNLTLFERFLYCEITALSNMYGYCFATNEHFADLYNKSPETISRALKKLKDEKHITLEYEQVGTKKTNRKIYPLTNKQSDDIIVNGERSIDKNVNGELQKILKAIDKNVKYNNITYKDIFNTITYMSKDKINTSQISVDFKKIYDLYPRKGGYSAISDKTKEKIVNLGYDIMSKCIDRFKAEMESENRELKFYVYAKTFFNTTYADYLNDDTTQEVHGASDDSATPNVTEYGEIRSSY